MNQQKYISPDIIVFSKWSRKEYAIFASLGKLIKIGVLKADICQKALLKGLVDITTIAKTTENFEEDENEASIADRSFLHLSFFVLLLLSVFNLTSATVSREEYSFKNITQRI